MQIIEMLTTDVWYLWFHEFGMTLINLCLLFVFFSSRFISWSSFFQFYHLKKIIIITTIILLEGRDCSFYWVFMIIHVTVNFKRLPIMRSTVQYHNGSSEQDLSLAISNFLLFISISPLTAAQQQPASCHVIRNRHRLK